MNPLFRNDRPGHYPQSWYAETAKLPLARPALTGDISADVVIVGAGFTGLTAALHLAQKGYDVTVIDAHRVGFGASGRNGGQCGSGFNMDQRQIEDRLGRDTAQTLWALAEEGKSILRTLAETHAPDAGLTPGVAHGLWASADMPDERRYADHLAATYGYDQIETLDPDAFRNIVNSPAYQGGSIDWGAAHLHPLRYCLGLAKSAEAAGATLYENTEAQSIEPNAVLTATGRIAARYILLAGNGYLPGLDPSYAARVCPINSFIGATEPLGPKAATVLSQNIAVADDRFVVNYFRLSEDNRLLFGGRENYGIGFPKDISTRLHHRMVTLFPQLSGIPFTHVWGGTLGITMTRVPFVSRLSPTTLAAGGFSGHGVALTAIAGRTMAEAVAGHAERFDTLSTLPTPPFPGGASLRAPLLTLAMTWYALRDRLGL